MTDSEYQSYPNRPALPTVGQEAVDTLRQKIQIDSTFFDSAFARLRDEQPDLVRGISAIVEDCSRTRTPDGSMSIVFVAATALLLEQQLAIDQGTQPQ